MKITAAQHVSAMLTSRQSPRGDAGFQTLYHTRESLAPQEVSVIERLVQYSSARESKPKWQSYRLSARRHVVTRVVPIPEPDESGRTGRYFTHSLICDVPAGPQFDAALPGMLQPHNFLTSLDDVLASGDRKTGRAPAVTFDVAEESSEAGRRRLREWSGEELNRLYRLMSDPRQLTERGLYVSLSGNDEQIVGALRVAFLIAPPSVLKHCSFDTNPAGGASPPEGAFWGRGHVAGVESSYAIDAARRQVRLPESSPLSANGLSPESLSEPLRKAVAARLGRPSEEMLRRLAEHQYAAFIGEPLYETLLNEPGLSLKPADSEVLRGLSLKHRGLDLLLCLKSGDHAGRLRALASMDAPAYKEWLGRVKALPDFRPWQAYSPIFTPTWFDFFRGTYSTDDLTAAVAQVAAHGNEQDLEYLSTLAEHLSHDERRALGGWLGASPLRLDGLRLALEAADRRGGGAVHTGEGHSLLRRITHPFGK